ncbi:MAG: metal-dependent hydrolase [Acidobacteriia bacterium]|nr:metal-dependent hydrolase [Terriglobia bacterium]
MASLFTHAVVAVSLSQGAPPELRKSRKFWWMVILCSIVPDIDVIGFSLGIRYGDLWGHRGLTHSLLFAALLAVLAKTFTAGSAGGAEERRERQDNKERTWGSWKLALLLFVITASHGVLDAMTNGGLGVAFLSPFNPHRYFLPWRPIVVSPIGAGHFFSARGLQVLSSEIVWIWGPAALLAGILRAFHTWRKPTESSSTSLP